MSITSLIRTFADLTVTNSLKLWRRLALPFRYRQTTDGVEGESNNVGSIFWGYAPVVLVALIGLAISFTLFNLSKNWEKRQVEIAFQETAQDRILLIQREIKFSFRIIQDIASFIEASEESIGRKEFRKFVGPALKNQASIKSLAWVPKVGKTNINEFIAAARKSFPPFQITEINQSGSLTSALSHRQVYYPILYVQPYQDNKQLLGLDIGADKQVLPLFHQSANESKLQITTTTITDKQNRPVSGIIVVAPVFHDTSSEQVKTVRGFVFGIFYLGEVVEKALDNIRPGSVDIKLYLSDQGAEGEHLYTHLSRVRKQQIEQLVYNSSNITYSQQVRVKNQVWSIVCTPASDRFEVETLISWFIFFGGIAFTTILTIYTASLVGRTHQIRRQVAERTVQLRSTVEELNQEVIERKTAEAKLQNLNETLEHHIASRTAEAERRAEYLEQFAYVISHDLKAPLRAVSNLAEWIEEDLEDKLDSASREQLALLRDRVRRMHDLIEGLLEYSRVGKTSDVEGKIDTYELIQEVTDSLSPQKGFTIKVKGDMPLLNGDRLQLGQVFSNLISNSLKHHGGKKGKIRISCEKVGEFYEFSVTDNGQGISPEYHDKVFKMFQTLESRDYDNNTGIGLALVKKIVVEHGGSIRLKSAAGEGACFTFSWPIKSG
jgi:signal transduction histidine kinase